MAAGSSSRTKPGPRRTFHSSHSALALTAPQDVTDTTRRTTVHEANVPVHLSDRHTELREETRLAGLGGSHRAMPRQAPGGEQPLHGARATTAGPHSTCLLHLRAVPLTPMMRGPGALLRCTVQALPQLPNWAVTLARRSHGDYGRETTKAGPASGCQSPHLRAVTPHTPVRRC